MQRFFLSVCLIVLSVLPVASQTLDPDAKGKRVVLHLDVKLTREQKRALISFKNRATFYAAVAVNLDEMSKETSGFAWGTHSLEAAQDMALKSCEFIATTKGRCVLLASIIPATRPAAPDGWGMNHEMTKYYRSIYKNLARKKKGHFALASNDYWAWGWSGEFPTREQAEGQALEYCRKNAAKTGANKSASWRAAVVDPDRNACRIRLYVDASKQ